MRKGLDRDREANRRKALFASTTNKLSLLKLRAARLPSYRLRVLRDSVPPDKIEKLSFTRADFWRRWVWVCMTQLPSSYTPPTCESSLLRVSWPRSAGHLSPSCAYWPQSPVCHPQRLDTLNWTVPWPPPEVTLIHSAPFLCCRSSHGSLPLEVRTYSTPVQSTSSPCLPFHPSLI